MQKEEQKLSEKNLILFDLDGTIMRGYSQKILLQLLKKTGIISSADLLRISVWFILFKIGFYTDIAGGMTRVYAKLAGYNVSTLDQLIDKYFYFFKANIYSEAYQIIRKHQSAGNRIFMISTSIEPLVKRICTELGIENYLCTKLESISGKYSGQIDGKVLNGSEKLIKVKLLISESNKEFRKIYFYNDHSSEMELMNFVDVAVCVNPDPQLYQAALKNNWEILYWGMPIQMINLVL
jgi:HAD superfamily hydrolase (TIGR01490 family)